MSEYENKTSLFCGEPKCGEVIYNLSTGGYRLAPIYDCGQSFLKHSAMPPRDILDSELYKFKTKPFSTNPEKNLIDTLRAKQIAKQFIDNAGGAESVQTMEIEPFLDIWYCVDIEIF